MHTQDTDYSKEATESIFNIFKEYLQNDWHWKRCIQIHSIKRQGKKISIQVTQTIWGLILWYSGKDIN